MKNALIIASIAALIAGGGVTVYYLGFYMPSYNEKVLAQEKEKQSQELQIKKLTLKNECLKVKYSQSGERYGNFYVPSDSQSLNCD